jgi:large subunit ribosomal protein L6e
MARHGRSKHIAPHVGRLSRSQVKGRRGFHKGLKTGTKPAKDIDAEHKEVKVGGEKNGSTRIVPTNKAARYYPAEDVQKPKKSRKSHRATALRPSITPGTILILLAGRFRGKRVVFLSQLTSGLLLVTGPFKLNGVPLRRVNQAYVIATSTKVDLHHYHLDKKKYTDSYFAKTKTSTKQTAEEEFFADGKPKPKEAFPENKAHDQKSVDKHILEAIKKQEHLGKYLSSSWGLSNGQYPHELVF